VPAFRPAAVSGVVAGHAVGIQLRAEAHRQRDRLAGQRVARVELVAVLDPLPHGAVVGDLQFIRGIRAENMLFHRSCPVCDEWSKRRTDGTDRREEARRLSASIRGIRLIRALFCRQGIL